MKLDIYYADCGTVQVGDVVTVRRVNAYAKDRDYQNGRYATITRTSRQTFDTGNGAMDHHDGEATVQRVINDGKAVITGHISR